MLPRKPNLCTNFLVRAEDRHWHCLSLPETCALGRNYSYALRDDGGTSDFITGVRDIGVPGTPSHIANVRDSRKGMLTSGHFK